mgnify:CR=1 FL=1
MKKMATYILVLLVCFFANALFACETCKIRQPKITRNFVHGVGPDSNWDWFIVAIVFLLTVLSLFLSIKLLVKPGEKDIHHIKYSMFKNK